MKHAFASGALFLGLASACGGPPPRVDAGPVETPLEDGGFFDAGEADAGRTDAGHFDAGLTADAGEPRPVDPYADRVSRVRLGDGSGFGQDRFPDVVLGPPTGGGLSSGSLDVLSLGREGVIEVEFTDLLAVDGPGVDLLVFENPFGTFFETGVVAVSDDGVDWREFPCEAQDLDGGFPGCAGVRHVFANPAMGISATDPLVAGGDGFDLAAVGLSRARFVRVRDSGANRFYASPGGGFDLDAIAVVNGRLLDGGTP
jgi:hypothetical protein